MKGAGAAILSLLVQAAGLQRTSASGQVGAVSPEEACVDFRDGGYPGSVWSLDDCLSVWRGFVQSVPPYSAGLLPHVSIWRETANELRRVGSPCLVSSTPTSDGVGSATMRHFDSWIFAREMGCDWVTPDWGNARPVEGGNGTVMYCHRTATTSEMGLSNVAEEKNKMRRCTVVNWLEYFQFNLPSVERPLASVPVREIEVNVRSAEALTLAKSELTQSGIWNRPWDRAVISFHPSFASSHFISAGSWNEEKREITRNVLSEARSNFHRSPRPWYEKEPKCAYDAGRMHFAIHVRLGDRREFQDGDIQYFQLLEVLMSSMTSVVTEKGMAPPLFHVFSETLELCPSPETGLFDEFPTWPVELDQVPPCLAAPMPTDCPEKRAGMGFCSPQKPGIYRIQDKPIVLHVGTDVHNDLSCMIQADAVIMGCSTFGQIAGLLTKGISLFSMQCMGACTPDQYKTIPPLAVAERGRLWVPLSGSWRDPVLVRRDLFAGALDHYLEERVAASV